MSVEPQRPERFLPLPVVKDLTSMGRNTIYEHIRQGRFPAPVKVGRRSAWPESEIARWIEARKAARSTA